MDGLKRLMELISAGGGKLSVVLVGQQIRVVKYRSLARIRFDMATA